MKSDKARQKSHARVKNRLDLKPGMKFNWRFILLPAILLVITFIAYLPVFQNGISTWDDDAYITHNPLIYSLDLKEIFSGSVMGNYHPMTILALAVEYQLFGLNATGFHTVNLLLHLLNVVLVFYVIHLFSNKIEVALVASLLFGIHPMHAESVAWVAEQKDLLYTCFFLASLILYLKYVRGFHRKHYILALLFFLLSLLSKAMAAPLPVVLLLADYFQGRKIDKKAILEKVPFFVLAVIFGIIAILAQQSQGAANVVAFNFPQRILIACYGFVTYLVKLIFPLKLSAYYPYPAGGNIPGVFYIYLILFIVLVAAVIYSIRYTKKIVFGLGFFAATIFLVLQLFPVGSAIMADRYSYVASIGIFYLAGEGFAWFLDKKWKRMAGLVLMGITAVLFVIKTHERSGIWKNDLTLWTDVISQDPTAPLPFNNRGYYFLSEGKNEEAIADFNKAIELDSANAHAYNLRGMANMHLSRNQEAISDFNRSIELKPGNAVAIVNRGWLLMNESRNDEAIADFNRAIELDPGYAVAYNDRGIYFINNKRYDEAAKDFDKAIALDPGYTEAYYDRGNVAMLVKRYDEAVRFYTRAIETRKDYAQAYYYRGIAALYLGRKEAACNDLKQAAASGFKAAEEAITKYCK